MEKYLQVPNKMQKQVQTGTRVVLKRVTSFLTGPRQILTLVHTSENTHPNTPHCSTKINRIGISRIFLRMRNRPERSICRCPPLTRWSKSPIQTQSHKVTQTFPEVLKSRKQTKGKLNPWHFNLFDPGKHHVTSQYFLQYCYTVAIHTFTVTQRQWLVNHSVSLKSSRKLMWHFCFAGMSNSTNCKTCASHPRWSKLLRIKR